MVENAAKLKSGARVFAYHVHDPERYGVVEFDKSGKAISLRRSQSSRILVGCHWPLFLRQRRRADRARAEAFGPGELEITDLNREYLKRGDLLVSKMGRGIAWLDSGTYDSLLSASQFVQTLELRQGLKVACLEEISYHKGFISADQLVKLSERYSSSPYGQYLKRVLIEDPR